MTSSSRKDIRERRQKRKRQQRVTTLLIIFGIVLILVALAVAPQVYAELQPAGDIVQIDAQGRPMEDGRAMGDPNAPVVVEAYSDFQCVMCQVFAEETESLITENYVATGQVYYIYRQFPFLDDRAASVESDQAANASMCAAEQNRFWDYHDMLFANRDGENQGAFRDKRLVAFAEALGIDMPEFEACFDQNRYEVEINNDMDMGIRLTVQGTPSIFVNGKAVSPGYVPTFEEVQQAIEAELVAIGQ
jgi:protein-disulfide isomerase